MQLQQQQRASVDLARSGARGQLSSSSLHALTNILHIEGIRGLYRGFAPSLMLCTHGAVLLVSYDHFMALWPSVFVSSFCAKVFATSITYPLQVIRSVMQQPRPAATSVSAFEYSRLTTTAWLLWQRDGGIRAFYRGLSAQMLRTVPQAVALFSIYEQVISVLAKGRIPFLATDKTALS
jgi:hypothetical protein